MLIFGFEPFSILLELECLWLSNPPHDWSFSIENLIKTKTVQCGMKKVEFGKLNGDTDDRCIPSLDSNQCSDMLCQRTPRTREELPPTTYNCTPALDTEEPHNSYTCKH